MKNYIDGLLGPQKLYGYSFFLLFLTFVINFLGPQNAEPKFSTVPFIGLKSSSDLNTVALIVTFSMGISIWVSVNFLWWLHFIQSAPS